MHVLGRHHNSFRQQLMPFKTLSFSCVKSMLTWVPVDLHRAKQCSFKSMQRKWGGEERVRQRERERRERGRGRKREEIERMFMGNKDQTPRFFAVFFSKRHRHYKFNWLSHEFWLPYWVLSTLILPQFYPRQQYRSYKTSWLDISLAIWSKTAWNHIQVVNGQR